jgi:hypothetical protein
MKVCKYCGFEADRLSDEDCPDNPNNGDDMKFIIVFGELIRERRFIGPFDDRKAAEEYKKNECCPDVYARIVALIAPVLDPNNSEELEQYS